MFLPTKRKLKELAEASANREICGFFYHTMTDFCIYPCKNISESDYDFEIDPEEYVKCSNLGRICGIYHSHPVGTPAAFSLPDLDLANELELPLYLYHLETDKVLEYFPKNYKLNLESLPFIWAIYNCYQLVRMYYRQNFNIYMNDYDYDDRFETSDPNIIMNNFEKENFYNVGSTSMVKKHDVLVFRSSRAFPQHFGIFVGNSKMLHHPLGKLSIVETIDSFWLKRLEYIFRYKGELC